MFSKKLSIALLVLCDNLDLTLKAASEKCGISSRFFGSVVREQSSPSIRTLEKMCAGLNRTPNELLGFAPADGELAHRREMKVRYFRRSAMPDGGYTEFPICPRCMQNMEREYQAFCDKCGQRLVWSDYWKATRYIDRY